MQLTILHTNDLHGHVQRLAVLSSMARRIRREVEAAGGISLLVDAGDAEEKSLLESDVTKGAAVMALLSAAGYQAMAVGNGGPLGYGPQCLAGMAAAAAFPLLAANFTWAESGHIVEGVQPAVLLDLGGLKVGLIGLAPTFDTWWGLFGLRVPQGNDEVRCWRDKLRESGATIIVVLSHQGSRSDQALARAVDGLDVIVGGHVHEVLPEGLWEGSTLIAQAGDFGRFLGRVDLTVDEGSRRVTAKSASLLPLDESLGPDPAVVAEYRRQQALVEEMLQEPIGETLAPFPLDPLAESAMGNFPADVLRERMQAQVALCISGMLNAGLPGGPVTLGDLCHACSSPANPGRMTLSGAQLREMLDLGLDPQRARRTPRFLRGRPLGIVAVSGMRVAYDPAATDGRRVQKVWVGLEPLRDDELYSVAGTDFEVDGMSMPYTTPQEYLPGVSFTIPDETVRYDLPTVLREALADHLRRHSPVAPPEVGRLVEWEIGGSVIGDR